MAITNDLLSSTLRDIAPDFVDQLFKKTALLDWAKKEGGMDFRDGGTTITVPLSLKEHSSITQYPTGFEPADTSVQTISRPANFIWNDYSAPIAIAKKEELENTGDRAIVRILEGRTKNVFSMLRRETNLQLVAGTSVVLTDLGTLNGVASSTGFLENLDAGSQTNVVGGVSKATYQNTTGWQNQRQDVNNAADANLLDAMDAIRLACNNAAPTGEVKLILCSTACIRNYRKKLQAQERYINEKTLDAGRTGLAYNNAMMEQETAMPTNGGVGTNEFSQLWINFDALKLTTHSAADYAPQPFCWSQGNTVRLAHVYHKMQLTTDHLGSLGLIVRADTF